MQFLKSVSLALLLGATVGVSFATGQTVGNAQAIEDAGLWFAALGNGRFETRPDDSPWRWWFDAHYRLRDDTDGFNQSIVRPGLGYALNEQHALWAGYGWILTSPILGDEFDEHRFWQQWTATPSRGNWKFLHRSRYRINSDDDNYFVGQ